MKKKHSSVPKIHTRSGLDSRIEQNTGAQGAITNGAPVPSPQQQPWSQYERGHQKAFVRVPTQGTRNRHQSQRTGGRPVGGADGLNEGGASSGCHHISTDGGVRLSTNTDGRQGTLAGPHSRLWRNRPNYSSLRAEVAPIMIFVVWQCDACFVKNCIPFPLDK
jgi:hypothetical protein